MSRTSTRGRFTRPGSSSNMGSQRHLRRASTGRSASMAQGHRFKSEWPSEAPVGRAPIAFGSIWRGSPSRRGMAAICQFLSKTDSRSRGRIEHPNPDASPGRRFPHRPLLAQVVGERQIAALMSAIASVLRSSSGLAKVDGDRRSRETANQNRTDSRHADMA